MIDADLGNGTGSGLGFWYEGGRGHSRSDSRSERATAVRICRTAIAGSLPIQFPAPPREETKPRHEKARKGHEEEALSCPPRRLDARSRTCEWLADRQSVV